MAVNLVPPDPQTLRPVAGVELGVAEAGVRKANRRDLLLVRLPAGAAVSGVFTQNRFCAAPVIVSKRHLGAGWEPRGLIVNTGNANAGTGEDGIARARAVCVAVARELGCAVEQILPFSTGVIMESLPAERIIEALPNAFADLREDNWLSAATAIMTTDTVPKAASRGVQLSEGEVTVTGISKGSGMIRPDMATMLAFIATDAVVARGDLTRLLGRVVSRSFNCITVDGDTSTNDALILIASGASGTAAKTEADLAALEAAIEAVAVQLAQAIVRDGEGATKFVTLQIERGRNPEECRQVAYAIAHSPLVKTAFFASDPNLGRILSAIGNAGVAQLDPALLDLFINDVRVASGGARAPDYDEARAVAAMRESEFSVRVVLNRGSAAASVWTCDLSFDYVKINAEYRT